MTSDVATEVFGIGVALVIVIPKTAVPCSRPLLRPPVNLRRPDREVRTRLTAGGSGFEPWVPLREREQS